MRLLIEIPDDMFNRIQDDVYSTYDGVDCLKVVRNGTPIPTGYSIGLAGSFDKTLEEIRKEINDLPKTYPFINHIDTYVKTDDVIRIIDRHIGESKDAEWKESEPLDDVVELMERRE